MKIRQIKSPNFDPRPRSSSSIKFIIIHYTGMQSTRVSLKRLISQKAKVSSHYLIGEKGEVFKLVDENSVAWHAGKSKWKNFSNLNNLSIGIELSNKGHLIKYENYKKKQLASLVILLKLLVKKFKVPHENVLGHSDIAPLRKKDPGEKFPWISVLSKVYPGYNFVSNKDLKIKKFKSVDDSRKHFFNNLKKIGYRYFSLKKKSSKDKKVVIAFQRKFRPKKIDGAIDQDCIKISDQVLKMLKKA